MRTLVVNPGSSSLKLSVVDGGVQVASRTLDGWGGVPARWPILDVLAASGPVDAVGVRIAHGGDRDGPRLLDEGELRALEEFVPLAPLHQPRSLALARVVVEVLPDVRVFGCFDTSFHAGMPAHATTYPVPREWTERFRLRRYGFHGLSCAYAVRAAAGALGRDPAGLSLLCCHVGSGVSVTAVLDGRSVDTSMGLTPLDGVAMATRSGGLDPGLLLHVQRTGGLSAGEVESALTHHSGLAGLSGTSGDVRRVLAARAAGDEHADLAIRVYLHRLRREIGAARVSLDRLDALVLTGGVAEHEPALVAELLDGLAHLGIAVAPAALAGTGDRVVSPETARTRVLLVAAGEDVEIAHQVERAGLAV
ncbi:acetate/propionate family kinase [Umezawaea endophytica]|uniref:Acetate kinase n=1 Tax=Umezawaea endophytica TaxID=1654476 RepID=A0A9X3AFY6_9PSEU|nr:acetate kinase [Umezawaea endophytica]MCS7479357.1 acetate kinase [Umezawaea endophytica]